MITLWLFTIIALNPLFSGEPNGRLFRRNIDTLLRDKTLLVADLIQKVGKEISFFTFNNLVYFFYFFLFYLLYYFTFYLFFILFFIIIFFIYQK